MDIQTPPFLELHNAVVQRAGAPILTVDSFRLEEGEHLALLGPNGSGKSTFVKLITREVLPLHREVPPVRFRGSERATLADVKRSLGVVSSTMQDQISVHLPTADVVAGGLCGTLGARRGSTPGTCMKPVSELVRLWSCWGLTSGTRLPRRRPPARTRRVLQLVRSCNGPRVLCSTSRAPDLIPKVCITFGRVCARLRKRERESCWSRTIPRILSPRSSASCY